MKGMSRPPQGKVNVAPTAPKMSDREVGSMIEGRPREVCCIINRFRAFDYRDVPNPALQIADTKF